MKLQSGFLDNQLNYLSSDEAVCIFNVQKEVSGVLELESVTGTVDEVKQYIYNYDFTPNFPGTVTSADGSVLLRVECDIRGRFTVGPELQSLASFDKEEKDAPHQADSNPAPLASGSELSDVNRDPTGVTDLPRPQSSNSFDEEEKDAPHADSNPAPLASFPYSKVAYSAAAVLGGALIVAGAAALVASGVGPALAIGAFLMAVGKAVLAGFFAVGMGATAAAVASGVMAGAGAGLMAYGGLYGLFEKTPSPRSATGKPAFETTSEQVSPQRA